jgi:two-component system phosphate regulon sensor histidine kinase PhoR
VADPAKAEGKPAWEVTRVPEVGEALAAAVRTGRPVQLEARIPGSPRDRHLRLHASPLAPAGGRPQGAVLVLHDISELRRLEAVRRDFIANVSHELKTPLAAIRGFVETILEDEAMEEATARHFLMRVKEQTSRLTAMVEELLELSRIESERQRPAATAVVDVRAVVGESALAALPLAKERGLTLDVDLTEAPLWVRGEVEGLRRIAGNLLDNAVKYTPAGGRVEVRALARGEDAVVEVEDTGPGIPDDARERIFERFYRLDPGRSREAGGSGLGLSIVKHLAQSLGGEVTVTRGRLGGSLFAVRLPAVASGPGAAPGTRAEPGS